MLDKDKVINFGFPDILKDLNVQFCFDDAFANSNSKNIYYHGEDSNVKFFIRNMSNNQTIFTMDFYIRSHYRSAFSSLTINECHVRLQYIKTTSSFRKKGIATFYIKKLVDFCNDNNIHIITLDVAPSESDNENALNKCELISFYTSFSTDTVNIEII